MYFVLMDYIQTLENASINLLFDRTFFTEEVYCRLGFKEYSFTDIYENLLERYPNIHVIKIDNMKPLEETKNYIKKILE